MSDPVWDRETELALKALEKTQRERDALAHSRQQSVEDNRHREALRRVELRQYVFHWVIGILIGLAVAFGAFMGIRAGVNSHYAGVARHNQEWSDACVRAGGTVAGDVKEYRDQLCVFKSGAVLRRNTDQE